MVAGYITVSEALRRELAGRGIDPAKIIRIYNGINFHEFEPVKIIAGIPADRGDPKSGNEKGLVYRDIIHGNILCPAGDILKVGTAGRLVSQKGIDIFVKAAGRIVSRYDRVCFYIAGEGPERSRLEFLRELLGLQEKVFFLGDV